MKKQILVCSLSIFLILSGCSSNKNKQESMNTPTNPPQSPPTEMVQDSMDNMMNFFKEKGMTLDNLQPIETMDFAAYEGKTFTYNGKTAYLYRLKSNDEKMKALLDSAKETGKAKVNIEGEEKEYNANVNGDYLLLYPSSVQMDDVIRILNEYVPGNQTITPKSNQTPENKSDIDQSNPANEQNID